ncbi:hypothetical protein ASH00_06740 [Arthrobacter sp. Soil782]|uniref:hypothetical protein n=1 Tax=Arthrobacter sp. Soil782 TaxID=1736410 RepID=UPI0006F53464|nr:hypothetical protein [Arthrobacter sp. Soil782]KRF09317.1 hypothetical protein ASH00_06740 [Arthrobacter sp. Soil782]
MNDKDTHIGSRPAAADAADRHHFSSKREALVLATWTFIGALSLVGMFRFGIDLWAGARGAVILGGLIVLVVLFAISRARTRTVRPRHFNLVEAFSALWLGVGGGVALQVLGKGDPMPLALSIVAAAALTAPLFVCSVWLAVRGR